MLKQIVKNAQGVPTGEYIDVAGGTLYADMPVGVRTTWYNSKPLPPGFLRLDGSTFSQSEYPELYAILGNTNVLPKEFDHSRSDGWTEITVGTTEGTATTMTYDGVVSANFTQPSPNMVYISNDNGTTYNPVVNGTSVTDFGKSNCFPVKAGDKIYAPGYLATKPWYVRWHGSYKIIKAKQVALPADLASGVEEYIDDNAKSPISSSNKLVTESDINKTITVSTYASGVNLDISKLRTDCGTGIYVVEVVGSTSIGAFTIVIDQTRYAIYGQYGGTLGAASNVVSPVNFSSINAAITGIYAIWKTGTI